MFSPVVMFLPLSLEIFPDCQSYATFLKKDGVVGERKITKDVLTIDPDGAGGEPPFVVSCQFKDTVIEAPEPDGERKCGDGGGRGTGERRSGGRLLVVCFC